MSELYNEEQELLENQCPYLKLVRILLREISVVDKITDNTGWLNCVNTLDKIDRTFILNPIRYNVLIDLAKFMIDKRTINQ
jgi:hypothetical protein